MEQTESPRGPVNEDPAQYHHLYKAAFDNSNQGICVFDLVFDDGGRCRDFIFLMTNTAFDQQSPLRGVIGKSVRSLLPNFEQYWLDLYARVAETGRPESYENYVKDLDRWSRVHASRVGGAGSRTVLAAFENITERKRAEVALEAGARRQAFLLELADGLRSVANPIVIQETASRLVGNHLDVDRVGYAEIEGEGADAIAVLKRDWCRPGTESLVGRYHLDAFGKFLAKEFGAEKPVVIDDVLNDSRISTTDLANWKPLHIGAAIAHSLVKEGRFLAYLFVHVGRPRHWTAEEIALLGEVAERTWAAVERAKAEDALRKSHEMLEARVRERTQQVAIARDDAERNAALKSQFLAATAHDLRQPLQATLSYLSILRRRAENPDVEAICDRCKIQLQAMADILDTLLDLSRLEGGAITPQKCDFDVRELIEAVVTTHQSMAQAKGIGLSLAGEACVGHSDPALLDRVLANLVSNAIRYTAHGEVTVSGARKAGMVEISVRDTGIGIPADATSRIFDPFVQINNPARDRTKGLGLGLSIVRAIAQSLGHRIEVSSESGVGSTFRVFIPEAHRPAGADTGNAAGDVPGPIQRRLKVLLVDDEPAVADSMAMLLRMENCEVVSAGTCEAAIAVIDNGFLPSVIISDLRLPDGNGRDLIVDLRRHAGVRIPAVLLTGEIQAATTASSDFEVLYKPVDFDKLMTAITQAGAS